MLAQKYFWPFLRYNVEVYVKDCDVYLASKTVKHKSYGDVQFLPISTHLWKDLSMHFITGLPISTNWKGNSYNFILVIVDQLTKMVYYELVKITINAPGRAKVIINIVICYHGLPDSIVTNRSSLFTSKFCLLFYSLFCIKRWLSTTFHPQTDGQTKRQESIIEAYLRAFINFEQNDWAQLLPMTKFAYNNGKNASTGHMPFELNYGYHFWMSYKENIDPYSKSKLADKLLVEILKLMTVCQENLHHAQKLQKQAHNKNVKLRSYDSSDKVWLNSKYLKTK